MTSIRKLLILLCCYLCGVLLLSAQQKSGQTAPLGIWEGALQVSGSELPLRFNIFKDQQERVCCTMDSPSQMATGIEATIELAEGIVVTIPNLYIRYEGKLTSSDTIVGTFAQGGMSLPLTLVRASKPAKADRPQTPQPPYPYETEEVTFYNGTAPLHGTLTYPVGHQAGSRVEQVVLFVSGSGIQDRDETLAEHKPFAVLADYLARYGVATLRYDDRGYHDDIDSTTVAEVTTATLADDAAAAVRYLRGRRAFDKVGVLGHSEGGTIAFILAARGIPDFIISLAGSTLPGKEVLQDQMDLSLVQAGLSEELRTEYLRATMATFDLAAQSDLRGEALVTKVLSEGHYQLPIGLVLELKKVADGLSPWLIYFTQYDPKGDIAQTHCPVLALNGSLDQQVLADKHLAVIEQSLPTGTPRQALKLEGLNHLFQHATTGAVSEYYQINETIAPEVLELIAEWISN
ncbi:alpha/beta hydrolase [uncultured Porphyromonas sp.]|uniref:alpha/beta hydrolase family protein n=1 Tax=uncultured Porphyromonas sp. TaxID=159274 RepID=UPI0026181597|nr:alpha/beta hydrolase [uncultured Porphyromonas sp.]